MVLIDGKNRVFAFDRDNNPFKIDKLAFIHRSRGNPSQPLTDDEFISDTLVDAEMVIDRVEKQPGGQLEDVPRLLIYDLITLQVIDNIFIIIIIK